MREVEQLGKRVFRVHSVDGAHLFVARVDPHVWPVVFNVAMSREDTEAWNNEQQPDYFEREIFEVQIYERPDEGRKDSRRRA